MEATSRKTPAGNVAVRGERSQHAAVSECEVDEGVRRPPEIDCACRKEPSPGNPSHFPLSVDGHAAPLVDVEKAFVRIR